MNWTVTIYAALLFFILTPAVLVRLPPKGSKYTVAAFHALVFALIFHFTAKLVWQVGKGLEGFSEGIVTSECKLVGDGKGSGLQPPNDGTGNQKCGTINSDYCKTLEYEGNPKGFYSYNKETRQCAQATAAGTGAKTIATAQAKGTAPAKVASTPGVGASRTAQNIAAGTAKARTS